MFNFCKFGTWVVTGTNIPHASLTTLVSELSSTAGTDAETQVPLAERSKYIKTSSQHSIIEKVWASSALLLTSSYCDLDIGLKSFR